MKFYSTNNRSSTVSLKTALFKGQAQDGGLFMPEIMPEIEKKQLRQFGAMSIREVAFQIAKAWLHGEMSDSDLEHMIKKTVTYDVPIISLTNEISSVELYHGPTLSFKDFGARFMARLMEFYKEDQEVNILVATSGDTGSAVAQAFLDIPGIKVWILYPKDKISKIQELQLTTIGHNVTALEINGTFDDCQTLVKRAFLDEKLNAKILLSSANSINICRIIPQTFYIFYAVSHIGNEEEVVISIPSGNYGNSTAAIFAKWMGCPIKKIIVATNVNDTIPRYLKTGIYNPLPTQPTISNAIDISDPNNFKRIHHLFNGDLQKIREFLFGVGFTDEETKQAIQELYRRYHYIADPHGAIAYLGILHYFQMFGKEKAFFLETAHPAKFKEVVEPLLKEKIIMPAALNDFLSKTKTATSLNNDYHEFRDCLLSGFADR